MNRRNFFSCAAGLLGIPFLAYNGKKIPGGKSNERELHPPSYDEVYTSLTSCGNRSITYFIGDKAVHCVKAQGHSYAITSI